MREGQSIRGLIDVLCTIAAAAALMGLILYVFLAEEPFGMKASKHAPVGPSWQAFWVLKVEDHTFSRYSKDQCEWAKTVVQLGGKFAVCVPVPVTQDPSIQAGGHKHD